MISCHSLVESHKNCPRNFDKYDDEGIIGAQIFGAVPELMADAARILADSGAKWIDINMGCPVPKVATRANAGAYLMRDHKLAGKIMDAVVRSVDIPVSIKTRLGWDDKHTDWRNLIDIAADCGVRFAALHGRTRAQLYLGRAILPDVHDTLMMEKQTMKNTKQQMMQWRRKSWDFRALWLAVGFWDDHGLWQKFVLKNHQETLDLWCLNIWNIPSNIMVKGRLFQCFASMPRGTVRECRIRRIFVFG